MKNGDFTIHKSTIKVNQGHKIKNIFKTERKIEKKLNRDKILKYEKEMTGELVHIDLHKRKHGGINYITPMQKLENLLDKNLVCL